MKQQVFHYLVVLDREADGKYSVTVPDIPGCFTWGLNLEHALEMAREAIEVNIEHLLATGQSVPEPSHMAQTIEVSA